MKVTITFELTDNVPYKYVARDADGEVVLFSDKPVADMEAKIWNCTADVKYCQIFDLAFSRDNQLVMELMRNPWHESLAQIKEDGTIQLLIPPKPRKAKEKK